MNKELCSPQSSLSKINRVHSVGVGEHANLALNSQSNQGEELLLSNQEFLSQNTDVISAYAGSSNA